MKQKLLSACSCVFLLGIFATPLTSCVNSSSIVFANFESYMSNDLMKKMTKKYGVQFLYYSTNEDIEIKFSQNYDLAIPSTYELLNLLQQNELMKIDWSRFNLNYQNDLGETIQIKNGTDALNLFTENVQNIILFESDKYSDLLPNGTNLLDYGIPYFLQSFIFAYKGAPINTIDNATTFDELLNQISPKLNPNVDERFLPKNKSKIAMVDDSRTVYDMCKLIQNQQDFPDDENQWNINPTSQDISINEFKNTYSKFTDQFDTNYFYLNTDSNEVLTSFAEHKNGNNSIFAYNGDILYATQGGGLYDAYTDCSVNVFNPSMAPLALDMVVFNKKNENNPDRLNKIYDIAYDMLLDGCNVNQQISETNENDEYVYGPMINFDFVQYTSPLKAIDEYVNDAYFQDCGFTDENFINLLLDIYNIPTVEESKIGNLIEDPISNLNKSNMHWAYVEEREKL